MAKNLKKDIELIARLVELKKQKAEIDAEMKELNSILFKSAIFEGEKKTSYIQGAGFRAKCVKSEDMKWDQSKLNAARATLGDEIFLSYFDFSWKHADKGAVVALMNTKAGKPIKDALTVVEKTAVTIEEVTIKE